MKRFYPYISDLSYAAAARERDAIDSLKNTVFIRKPCFVALSTN